MYERVRGRWFRVRGGALSCAVGRGSARVYVTCFDETEGNCKGALWDLRIVTAMQGHKRRSIAADPTRAHYNRLDLTTG